MGHMQIMWFLPQPAREGSDSISFRLWSASWSWSPWPPDSGSPSLCNCRRGSHDNSLHQAYVTWQWFTLSICHMTMVYIKRMSHDNSLHQAYVTWQWFTSSVCHMTVVYIKCMSHDNSLHQAYMYVTWQWFTSSVCHMTAVYINCMSNDNGLHQAYVTWQLSTVCTHLVFSVCEVEIVSTIENIGTVCLCAYSLVSMESINCPQPHNHLWIYKLKYVLSTLVTQVDTLGYSAYPTKTHQCVGVPLLGVRPLTLTKVGPSNHSCVQAN